MTKRKKVTTAPLDSLAGVLFPVAVLGLTLAILSLAGCTVSQPYTPEPIPLGTPASN